MKGKGNDGQGNVLARDLWETKQDFFEKLDNQYNFTFDCCANIKNTKKPAFSSNFEKQELNSFQEVCWMNPPFSKAKKMFKVFFEKVKRGCAIYRCDNLETRIWQNLILECADWVFIPAGRVLYTPFEVGNMRGEIGTRFPSALIGVGLEYPVNLVGKVLIVKEKAKEVGKE